MGARTLLPLILLLVFVGIVAAVGFVVYSIVQDVGKNTRAKMERKNIALTRDGMKVQVREVKDEAYKDRTQSVLFNMWNHTSFPAYKSRLWDMTGSSSTEQTKDAEKRKFRSNTTSLLAIYPGHIFCLYFHFIYKFHRML
ncbi:hypothetical protein PEX1_025670 [Penicillium expansum]|uniref:Uncharacterized protein n=1 Tax=Penicillium expansum TaxID=27334 RepID=A0A0A2JLK0_PENEN|nr:hypothetical protein PEX2_078660 [Penicillium expansum]KGO42217.1 hypothetical protein PEXP_051680 [Penicillium expansum]KGO56259.1 hypothetical protein PEX2_078660 [Penicillium expansum]KGO68832.1 hypothetical protein PEX1_025670 [Penicillium expansum]